MQDEIQCIWRVSGASFDVASFLTAEASIHPDATWHRGKSSPPRREPSQDSGFNALAAQGASVPETIERLRSRADFGRLVRAAYAAGARSELEFSVFVTPMRPINSARLRPADLRYLADLGVSVVISAYAAPDEAA
jgi:hypothetical protein